LDFFDIVIFLLECWSIGVMGSIPELRPSQS
jgi:hypothetical protein